MKQFFISAFVDHPKTTIQGILTLAIALLIAYSALPAGAKWPVVGIALSKTALSFFQNDAK